MPKIRSTTGCWTCRLRRKKCDEERPICGACSLHGLSCFNGSDKPSWMNGKADEKQQLDKIKSLVKKSAEERRLQRVGSIHRHRSSSGSIISKTDPIPSNSSAPSTTTSLSPADSPILICPQAQLPNTYGLPFIEGMSKYGLELQHSLPTPPLQDLDFTESWIESDSGTPIFDDYLQSPDPTHDLPSFLSYAPSSSHLTPTTCSYAPFDFIGAPSLTGSEPSNPSQRATPLPPASQSTRLPTLMDRGMRPGISDEEADALVYYLCECFPIQFPGYALTPDRGRGWIHVLLSRSKMALYSTMALSLLKRHIRDPKPDDSTSTHERSHGIAVRELRQALSHTLDSGTVDPDVLDIEILLSLSQLMLCEDLKENHEGWTMHLKAAASLIPASPCNLAATASDQTESIVIGRLVFYDILTTATLRTTQTIPNLHHICASWKIQMEDVFFCRTEVMLLIADIAALDSWKRTATKESRLSVTELVSRGHGLLSSLQRVMSALENAINLPNASSAAFESAKLHVSIVFASAATTYLHVVLSGAYPGLPEIQQSVTRSIDLMIDLPKHKWLQYLVWPFCVTGCMASESQRSFFPSIVSVAEIEEDRLYGISKALLLMEQCWHERERHTKPVDWVDAMESLDKKTLLL